MSLLPDGPIDTQGLRVSLLDLPEHLDAALDAGPVDGVPAATHVDHVVLLGGASAPLAVDLVAALVAPTATVPVTVHRAAALPAHVGGRSLVLAVALDDDPEVIAHAAAARAAGAAVVAVTTGDGALAELAVESGVPVAPVPVEVPVARSGAAAAAVVCLQIVEQLGHYAELAQSVEAAVAQLRRRRHELVGDASPAARLARRIGRTLPIVYGVDALGGVAAARWKHMVNRNAKAASFASSLPPLGRDEIAGWGQHGDMTRQVFTLVTLRHDHEPATASAQFALVEEMVDEVVHERHEVRAEGDGALAQVLDLCYVGDLVSWHLAQELEIDPGPDAAVDALRAAVSSDP